ncbi:hypothetical protein KSP40_PGU006616 [Platanthera guangdongensis]|uniref:Secreted protein n=1 Tax=Platanthera guangdongensis TaxID=2320717 RepID=A0ABR2LKC2_9ASPA
MLGFLWVSSSLYEACLKTFPFAEKLQRPGGHPRNVPPARIIRPTFQLARNSYLPPQVLQSNSCHPWRSRHPLPLLSQNS